MTSIPHATDTCGAFPFSNDRWTPQGVAELNAALAVTAAQSESGAALIIGAGSLPYTLDRLPSLILAADQDSTVVEGLRERVLSLGSFASWNDYMAQFPDDSQGSIEAKRSIEAGLPGPITEVQAAAQRAKIVPFIGNVVARSGEIGAMLREQGRVLTFVNFTNVARYIRDTSNRASFQDRTRPGFAVLAQVLSRLPVDDDAVIIDSTVELTPRIYSPRTYGYAFGLNK